MRSFEGVDLLLGVILAMVAGRFPGVANISWRIWLTFVISPLACYHLWLSVSGERRHRQVEEQLGGAAAATDWLGGRRDSTGFLQVTAGSRPLRLTRVARYICLSPPLSSSGMPWWWTGFSIESRRDPVAYPKAVSAQGAKIDEAAITSSIEVIAFDLNDLTETRRKRPNRWVHTPGLHWSETRHSDLFYQSDWPVKKTTELELT